MTEKKYKEWFTPEAREHYWEKLYKDAEAEVTKAKKENEKLKYMLHLAGFERDAWKEKCNEYIEKYIDSKYENHYQGPNE